LKTKAAILFETGKSLELIEMEIPKLKPGQVLVEIKYSGVCGTQFGEIKGLKGIDKYLPHALGHEASGIVLEISHGVKKVKPQDRVALSWIKGSGADIPGTTYDFNGTTINSGAITTFSQYSVISENRINKIDDAMPFKEASLLGCAAATGIGAVTHAAQVKPGDSIAIFGVGGIGLCSILGADMMNATSIIAVDIHDWKLNFAKELGATHTINPMNANVIENIHKILPEGVKYAIESAGKIETMETAFKALRPLEGILVLVGNAPNGSKMSIDPHEFNMGKRIYGSWGGNAVIDEDIPLYAELFLAGKLKLDKLITHELNLKDINKAFDLLETGSAGRIVIQMDDCELDYK